MKHNNNEDLRNWISKLSNKQKEQILFDVINELIFTDEIIFNPNDNLACEDEEPYYIKSPYWEASGDRLDENYQSEEFTNDNNKPVITLNDFLDKVIEIGKTKNEEYCRVSVQIKQIRVGKPLEYLFSCYINDLILIEGKTMEESLYNLGIAAGTIKIKPEEFTVVI